MELPADPSKLQFGAYHSSAFDQTTNQRNTMWQLSDDNALQQSDDLPFYFDIYN